MSGVVNVWGGECLGGEHLTIVILQLQVGKALDSLTREGPQVENENKYDNV